MSAVRNTLDDVLTGRLRARRLRFQADNTALEEALTTSHETIAQLQARIAELERLGQNASRNWRICSERSERKMRPSLRPC